MFVVRYWFYDVQYLLNGTTLQPLRMLQRKEAIKLEGNLFLGVRIIFRVGTNSDAARPVTRVELLQENRLPPVVLIPPEPGDTGVEMAQAELDGLVEPGHKASA